MGNESKELGNDKTSKARHYFYIVAAVFSSFVFIQNWFLNDKLNALRDEQNAQNAWKQVAMKETARRLENAYLALRQKEAKYIEHCKSKPCNLPIDLMVLETEIKYDSIELIMSGNIDKEKYTK